MKIGSDSREIYLEFFPCLQLKEYEGKETAQLVDRYKFLDLYPCTTVELRSIGYTEVSYLLLKFLSLSLKSNFLRMWA